MDILLKMAAAIAAIFVALSIFSSLTWLIRLRIIAVIVVGMVLVGLVAWQVIQPTEMDGIVLFPPVGGAVLLCLLALIAGFIGYFLSWPHGEKIAVLAVPAGLAVWSTRSSSVASIMQETADTAVRYQVFAQIKWTALLWLIPVAAGFAGLLLGRLFAKKQIKLPSKEQAKGSSLGQYSNTMTALIGSVLIALFCIKILAQDIRLTDAQLGSVIAQPSAGQIAFAVMASFAVASFVTKLFLNASYIWTIAATAIMPPLCISLYARAKTVTYLAENFPAVFFAHPAVAILPVQMVSFGTLGAIAGYWLAKTYRMWRHQQSS